MELLAAALGVLVRSAVSPVAIFLGPLMLYSALRNREAAGRLNVFAGLGGLSLLMGSGAFLLSFSQIAGGPPPVPIHSESQLLQFLDPAVLLLAATTFGVLGLLTRRSPVFGQLGIGFSGAAALIPPCWFAGFWFAFVDFCPADVPDVELPPATHGDCHRTGFAQWNADMLDVPGFLPDFVLDFDGTLDRRYWEVRPDEYLEFFGRWAEGQRRKAREFPAARISGCPLDTFLLFIDQRTEFHHVERVLRTCLDPSVRITRFLIGQRHPDSDCLCLDQLVVTSTSERDGSLVLDVEAVDVDAFETNVSRVLLQSDSRTPFGVLAGVASRMSARGVDVAILVD